MIASASGASSTSMTPRRMSRPSRRLCSRHVSTSGAGSVATARPRTLAGSRASGRDRTAGRLADLVEARRRAFPQRLVGRGVGQVERERRAVVERDRAPQRQPEQVKEVAARADRGTGSRRSCAGAGGPPRSAPGGCRGAPPAARAGASCAGRSGMSGSENGSMGAVSISSPAASFFSRGRGGRGGGGLAVAPSSGQACFG